MYKTVIRLFPPTTALSTNPGEAELLVLRYVQDFQETVAKNSLILGTSDADVVRNALKNQLATYRTIWRFENYIKEIARVPAEGTVCKGR